MKKYILFAASALFTLSSCSDFLEEYSTDQRYCEKVQDIEDLIIGNAFMPYSTITVYGIETMYTSDLTENSNKIYPWLHLMDDDSEAFAIGDDTQTDYSTQAVTKKATALNMLGNIHYWQQEAYTSVENKVYDDYQWKTVYARVGALNSIIFNGENDVVPANKEEEVKLGHLLGEAYFLRAYYYFYLANIYGMPYSEATAASDMCVPMKISENIEDKYYSRNSVAEVYAQILADLAKAESYLKDYKAPSPKRVGLPAVKALLSRVYLYMERYSDVVKVCSEIEGMGYSVRDMKNMDSYNDNFAVISNPEVIFTMGSNTTPAVFTEVQMAWVYDPVTYASTQQPNVSAYRPSDDLMATYDANDLRRNFFYFNSEGYTQVRKYNAAFAALYNNNDHISDVFMMRYAEVLLNNAEAQAMLGNKEEARKLLNDLRSKRLLETSINSIPSDDSLIEFIRAERRRELCFEGGHRWFDLRRYAVNTKYPLSASFTIKHKTFDISTGTTVCTGYYELPFMSSKDAWTLPAPNYAIEFNRGALVNQARQQRTFVKAN